MSSDQEWWRGAVIYQIYPRSFMDSNGDGVGDLPGILQKLEYVASLGVDGIWISPFVKSPMKDFGYDISDYRDVDPIFGTLEDFKAILNRAHELGLKIIMDQVWCHTSDQHDWFKESRQSRDNAKHDWYVWADAKLDGTPPNNWLSWFGGPAWTWDARRRQYYLHHFLSSQPVLNYWNPDVVKAIMDIAEFWMDLGVDGFRLDVSNYYYCDKLLRDNPHRKATDPIPDDPPPSNPTYHQLRIHSVNQPENILFMKDLRALIDKYPGRCLLGEAAGENSEQVAAMYTQGGDKVNMSYSFGLLGSDMTLEPVSAAIGRAQRFIGDGWLCWATSNHDFKRVVSRFPGGHYPAWKALFASALGLTLRGSYCMYQGEELALPQAELAFEDLVDPYDKALYPDHVGRDGCRTPMPWLMGAPHAGFSTAAKTWLPVSPLHVQLAIDVQHKDENSTLNHMRRLIKWRQERQILKTGSIDKIEINDPLLSFVREYEGRRIVCVFNCGDKDVAMPLSAFPGASAETMADVGLNAKIVDHSLTFGPYGFTFFEL